MSQGNTGDRVKTVQYLLNQLQDAGLLVDGDFGALTAAAVKAFQSAQGIHADGIVNPTTWRALVVTVRQGDSGSAVKAVQNELSVHGIATAVSGTFDESTEKQVRAFESANGMAVTGVVDADAWKTLVL